MENPLLKKQHTYKTKNVAQATFSLKTLDKHLKHLYICKN